MTLVTAQEVREWAQRRGLTVGRRGPLSSAVIEAFNKAHRRRQFATQ